MLQVFLFLLLLIPLSLFAIADVAYKRNRKLQEMLLIEVLLSKAKSLSQSCGKAEVNAVVAVQVDTCGGFRRPCR